jgi:hypothetical protein
MNSILLRLKQPSTYAGLATLISLTGLAVSPEQWQAISGFVIAAVALYEVFRNEKK